MAAMKTTFLTLIFLTLASQISGNEETGNSSKCDAGSALTCYDKPRALTFKLIAIASILVTSVMGVSLPLFTRSLPALRPEKGLFVLVKAFASGVILATGYMHVLPDSFDCLRSECLPENPWRKFPFTTFVAMLSALVTLMLDSFAMALYKKRDACGAALAEVPADDGPGDYEKAVDFNKGDGKREDGDQDGSLLLRYKYAGSNIM